MPCSSGRLSSEKGVLEMIAAWQRCVRDPAAHRRRWSAVSRSSQDGGSSQQAHQIARSSRSRADIGANQGSALRGLPQPMVRAFRNGSARSRGLRRSRDSFANRARSRSWSSTARLDCSSIRDDFGSWPTERAMGVDPPGRDGRHGRRGPPTLSATIYSGAKLRSADEGLSHVGVQSGVQLMRWPIRCTCLLLSLAGLCCASSNAQSVTAPAMSSRTRALRDIEASQPSSLEALPESVDELWDRQVEADVQAIFQDPSLMRSGTGESDAGDKSSPASPDNGRVQFRRTASAATAWSPRQTAIPNLEAEPPFPVLPGHPVAKLLLLPGCNCAGWFGRSSLLSSGAGLQPKLGLSRLAAEKHDREQRQARALQKKSDRQCGQLWSGAAECRLKLNKANTSETVASGGNLQTRR